MYPVLTAPTHTYESILALSRKLSESLDLEPYLQSIIDHTCQLTDSEVSSILLYEEESGLLKFVATPRTQSQILKRIRVPLERSIAGQAYSSSQPVIVQNGCEKDGIFREVDLVVDEMHNHAPPVPLQNRERG